MVICAAAGFYFLPKYFFKASVSDGVIVSQAVTVEQNAECNRNGICEKDSGENILNCETDCRPSSFSKGGDPAPINNPPSIWGLQIIEISQNSARVNWNTDYQTICELRWGKSQEYEGGNVAEFQESTSHSIKLENLSESTEYHFKIYCSNDKYEVFTSDKEFATIAGIDLIPCPNVSDFFAWYIKEEDKIILRWKNPQDDFGGVQILRNEKYYPRDQWDGLPLCKGTMQICEDYGVQEGKKYYYAAFSYDKSNNYSSGVATSIYIGKEPLEDNPEKIATTTEAVSEFMIGDFVFSQYGTPLRNDNGKYVAKTKDMIQVSTQYDKLVRNAKWATIEINDGTKKQIYIFKPNRDKSAYISELYFDDPNIYPFTISIMEFSGIETKITGNLLLEGSYKKVTEEFGKDIIDEVIPDFILLIILSLILSLAINKELKRLKIKIKNHRTD